MAYIIKPDWLAFEELETIFDQMVKDQPRQGVAAIEVALAYMGREQWQPALEYLDRALATEPTMPAVKTRAIYQKAVVLHRLGKTEAAKLLIDTIDSDIAKAHGVGSSYYNATKELGVEYKRKPKEKIM